MVGWHAVNFGEGLIILMLFGRNSVYQALKKRYPAKHVAHGSASSYPAYNDIFRDISQKTNISSQLLLVSDAMGPNDDSCMDKQKEK